MQQAVGEDVPALGIGGELDLVDGEEVDVDVARHRLDGAHPVARPLRLDLLLAGDERDLVGADAGGDLVVDLAREQAQRQADHAAFVAEHALDGEVGLAGIGGPEHRRDVADARFEVAAHLQLLIVSGNGIAETFADIKRVMLAAPAKPARIVIVLTPSGDCWGAVVPLSAQCEALLVRHGDVDPLGGEVGGADDGRHRQRDRE